MASLLPQQDPALGLDQDSALRTPRCSIQDLPMGFPKERKSLNMDLAELGWPQVLNENACARVPMYVELQATRHIRTLSEL